jgi:NitT/TauT family transport system substrate-binding protein
MTIYATAAHKYNRRKFLTLMGVLMGTPLLVKCSSEAPSPLTIASQVWPGYELMFLARKEGWLPSQGLTLVETNSATESLKALSDGKVDGAALTLDEVLHARDQGIDLTVVMVFDVSFGSDMLLVKPNIETLGELAGKRIGVEQSAVGALMLHKILLAAQLSQADITIVPVSIDQHLNAWLDNQVDAIVSYDPIANHLVTKGALRLFDSRDIPDTIFDVLAIKSEAIQSHTKAIRGLIAGHFKARAHFLHNPQDASYRLATRLGLTGPEVLISYKNLVLPDIKRNRQFLSEPHGNLLTSAKKLSGLMIDARLLSRQDSFINLVNAEFLPEDL